VANRPYHARSTRKIRKVKVTLSRCLIKHDPMKTCVGVEVEIRALVGKEHVTWEDNNKMGFKEISCERVDWIQLAQDRDQ